MHSINCIPNCLSYGWWTITRIPPIIML